MQTGSEREHTARFTALCVQDHPRVMTSVHRRLGDRAAAEEFTAEVFRIAWEHVLKVGADVTGGWPFITARNLLGSHCRAMARLSEESA